MKTFNKISELKREIGYSLTKDYFEKNDGAETNVFFFQEEVPGDKFKITIEKVEENFFYDSNGVKWIKCEEQE